MDIDPIEPPRAEHVDMETFGRIFEEHLTDRCRQAGLNKLAQIMPGRSQMFALSFMKADLRDVVQCTEIVVSLVLPFETVEQRRRYNAVASTVSEHETDYTVTLYLYPRPRIQGANL